MVKKSPRARNVLHLERENNENGTWVRAVAVAALALAVVAVGLAGWAVLRAPAVPASQAAPSEMTATAAKAEICSAVALVREGVSLNTNLEPAGGPQDVTGSLAVAANARLSLYDGGLYLLAKMDPATPDDLAAAVEAFAEKLMDIGAAATAGTSSEDPAQNARLRDADAANATITELCT
jgi:hypothetical protein